MNCERVAQDELAEKYVSGRLEPGLQDEFEVHVLECGNCLRAVEVLEGVRAELSARAHEIRVAPAQAAGRKWLVWVPVAAVVLIAVAAGVLLNSRRTAREEANAPVSPTVTHAPAAAAEQAKVPSQPPAAKPSTPSLLAKQQKPGPVPKAAVKPEIAQAEPAPLPVVAPPAQQEVAASPAPTHPRKPQPPPLDPAVQAERFNLGIVNPPPYTFSGFAANAKPGKDTASTGYSHPGAAGGTRALFQRAMTFYVDQRYKEAATLLEDVVTQQPDAPDANLYLAVCRLWQGRPAQAVELLKAVVAKGSSPYLQAGHFFLAKAHIQTGDLAQAENDLEAAVSVPGRLSAEASALLARLRALRAMVQKAQQQ